MSTRLLAPPKPMVTPVQGRNVPAELKAQDQWLVWRYELRRPKRARDGKAKSARWTKVPYDHRTGNPARSNDRSTWTTYNDALAAYQESRSRYDGIGFVICAENGIIGGDLDASLDAERHPQEWSRPIIEGIAPSYCECSPSGKGVKFLVRSKRRLSTPKTGGNFRLLPAKWKSGPGAGVELYHERKYFTITGHLFARCRSEILDRGEFVCGLFEDLDAVRQQRKVKKPRNEVRSARLPISIDVQSIIEKARHCKNGDKFSRLFSGDWSGYPSQSEGDAALCSYIAFWTGPDEQPIDQVFRESGLYRDKWERKDYRTETINVAISGRTDFYHWNRNGSNSLRRSRFMELNNNGHRQPATEEPVVVSPLVGNGSSATPVQTDPGPLPVELLRIPGFVSEVMDHCLATAPYPNPALAFCGAVALQAVLAGRKVRDQGDNRTNLYLLALAYSSVGKDWPRKVNTHIMHRVSMVHALGEKFASGEGIQDSLFLAPAMLFQTDEIDGLLQSINKSRDARHENIMGTLLTMFSAANSIYPMRRKAGKEPPGVIDQPCLVVYGTAIPTHYYEALSERMLTNGFFARTLIVESGPRSAGQDAGIIDAPANVINSARWWADFNPGAGNLGSWHPQPLIVEADDTARAMLAEARSVSDAEYANAEARGDPVGTTVWGRVPEQVRKLALLYGVSANHRSPRIDAAAVRWATEFMLHQTRRMLFMARNHVAANPFHAECLRLVRKLRAAPEHQLPHSVLLKRMKIDANTFQSLVTTLAEQGDLLVVTETTGGRPQRIYRLLGEASNSG